METGKANVNWVVFILYTETWRNYYSYSIIPVVKSGSRIQTIQGYLTSAPITLYNSKVSLWDKGALWKLSSVALIFPGYSCSDLANIHSVVTVIINIWIGPTALQTPLQGPSVVSSTPAASICRYVPYTALLPCPGWSSNRVHTV